MPDGLQMCAVTKMEASEELCTETSDVCCWEVERDATAVYRS